MDVLTQIVVSGLTLGAMYAISTVGLSLVYGSLNMLNMAHGGILTIGGYSAYAVSQQLGWPPAFGFVAALVVGAAVGLLIFVATAWPLLSSKSFETNIFIATIGVGAVFEISCSSCSALTRNRNRSTLPEESRSALSWFPTRTSRFWPSLS